MLYNSCDINYALKQIQKITLFNNGKVVLQIENINQDTDNYFVDKGVMNYGGSINCTFNAQKVDTIEIAISSKDKIISSNTIIKTGGLVILGK